MCGGQKTTVWCKFFPSTLHGSGIEFGLLDLYLYLLSSYRPCDSSENAVWMSSQTVKDMLILHPTLFFFLRFILFLFVCLVCTSVCMYVHMNSGTCVGQMRVSGPLDVEYRQL